MKTKLNQLLITDYEELKSYLNNQFKNVRGADEGLLYAVAYVIVKDSLNDESDFSSLDTFMSTNDIFDDICKYLIRVLRGIWEAVKQAKNEFTADLYEAFLLFNTGTIISKGIYNTPLEIIRLALELLDISTSERVADLCCGYGTFIFNSAINVPDAVYVGVEINHEYKCIADMRADVLGLDVSIRQEDVLAIYEEEKFDKIFANPPFAVKNFDIDDTDNKALQYLNQNVTGLSKRVSSDWIFASAVINNLKDGGKAVCIVAPNSIHSALDRNVRKFFVESGYVESVISLPSNLLDTTAVSVVMVVLSFGNSAVNFVDAREVYTKGRRKNTLSTDDINEILNAVRSETAISKRVSKGKIADNDYELYPARYLVEMLKIRDGVVFDDVIFRISRGVLIRANELDELMVTDNTGLHYIMLNDIQDGIISDHLPNLKEIRPQYDRYCISDGDEALILSKNGPIFKAAYIKANPGEKLLINANMYIIHLKTEVINPIFLKAFFESNLGQEQLHSLCSGSTLPTISVESLKKIIIPLPDMDIQDRVAEKYTENLKEIKLLKERLNVINDKQHTLFDNYTY